MESSSDGILGGDIDEDLVIDIPKRKGGFQTRGSRGEASSIKVALRGHISPPFRAKMVPLLKDLARYNAEYRHRGSLIVNGFLQHCLDPDTTTELPPLTQPGKGATHTVQQFVRQCFNLDANGGRSLMDPTPGLLEWWKEESDIYPPPPTIPNGIGTKSIHDAAADAYARVLITGSWTAVRKRQESVLRWCISGDSKGDDVDWESIRASQRVINGTATTEQIRLVEDNEDLQNLVGHHSSVLGTPRVLVKGVWRMCRIERYLSLDTRTAIAYNYMLLRVIQHDKWIKKWTVAPITSWRTAPVPIDKMTLFYVLRAIGELSKYDKGVRGFGADKEFSTVWYHTVFVPPTRTRQWAVADSLLVDTDGVSATFHIDHRHRKRKKKAVAKAFKGKAAVPKSTKAPAKRKRSKRKTEDPGHKPPPPPGAPRVPLDPSLFGRRIVVVDPGRVNIVYSKEYVHRGGVWVGMRTWVLRRGWYNAFSRTNKWRRKYEEWKLDAPHVKEWEDALSTSHPKVASVDAWRTYLSTAVGAWKDLHDYYGSTRFARAAFDMYCGRQSVMHRYWQNMVLRGHGINEHPKVFYGDGSFASSGPGESSGGVPVGPAHRYCAAKHPDTVLIDEHLTTKLHSVCRTPMESTKRQLSVTELSKRHKLKLPPITHKMSRDVLFCRKCSVFVGRDADACESIRCCATALERPSEYCRTLAPETEDAVIAEGGGLLGDGEAA